MEPHRAGAAAGIALLLAVGAALLRIIPDTVSVAARSSDAIGYAGRQALPAPPPAAVRAGEPPKVRDHAADIAELAGLPSSGSGDPALECTDNCAAQRAGWAWAAKHRIADPTLCGGGGTGFSRGCEAYVETVAAIPTPRRD